MATLSRQSLVIVRVKSDSAELEGIGEAATIGGLSYGAESPESIKLTIDLYLAPALIGRDPSRFGEIMAYLRGVSKGNFTAKAAIEMALVDLRARALGVPACDLFGGRVQDELPLAWGLATGDAAKDIAEAEQMLDDRRHRIFKIKVGMGDPAADIVRVAAVKAALGDRASVRIDANQAWDEPTAARCIDALERASVDLIEQPVPRDHLDAMRRLSQRFLVPIMADEAVATPEDAFRIASMGAAGVLSLKLAKAGGLAATKKVAAIAEAAGVTLYGGTMLEGTIGTAASAHLFSTLPHMAFGCELFGPLLLSDDVSRERLDFRDFNVVMPPGPGFGISIDEDKLAFYRRDRVRSVHPVAVAGSA